MDAVLSIAASTRVPEEIVVVAQFAPSLWVDSQLKALETRGLLRVVFDSGRGLSRARNIAIRAVTTTHLLWTDDDCIVAPSWVEAHISAYEAHPDAALIFGSVDPPSAVNGGYVPTFDVEEELGTWSTQSGAASGMGANMSFPMSLIQKIGDFDERFGVGAVLGSGEDLEFSMRARAKGFKVIGIRSARVVHEGGVRPMGSESNTIWYRDGMGMGAVLFESFRREDWVGSALILRSVTGLMADSAWRLLTRKTPTGARMAAHLFRGSAIGFAKALRESMSS